MATKKKAAKKTAKRASRAKGTARQQAIRKGEAQIASEQAAKQDATRVSEQRTAAQQQQDQTTVDDAVPKEGDFVVVDIDNVPEALRTAPMTESLRGLSNAGMHGRTGRVTGQEDGPQGRYFFVEGPDFSQRVPAAAVKRADVFNREQSKATKKKSRSRKKK